MGTQTLKYNTISFTHAALYKYAMYKSSKYFNPQNEKKLSKISNFFAESSNVLLNDGIR